VDQVLDVDGGDYCFLSAITAAVMTLDTNTLTIFDNELFHPLIRQHYTVMRFDVPSQGLGQHSRTTFRDGTPSALLANAAVSESSCARRIGWLGGNVREK